jgi:integrase
VVWWVGWVKWQTKNEASIRKVPLHPRIESLGFLDYVGRVADVPTARVFPNLVPGGADSKYGHSFSKRWGYYRKKINGYKRGLDYHSFRHGVVTKLYEAGVPEEQIEELVGHEGGGTSRRVYKKKPFKLSTLKEAISKIEWPEDKIKPPQRRGKSAAGASRAYPGLV